MAFLDNALRWLGLQRVADEPPKMPTPPVDVNELEQKPTLMTGRRNVSLLRAAADNVDVIRAAINAKKRHVTALRYAVSGPDDDVAQDLARLLAKPVPGMTWRQWLGLILEDVLVLDAGAVYVWRTRGGGLYGLLPIDGSTIRPVSAGLIPQPPEIAYEQYIAGGKVASLTTEELLYAVMNPRTHTRYGFSPTEAVLHTASIALRRMDGFADELDDSNVPAFFGEVPEGWQPNQIEEWQTYWDALTKNKPHRGVWGPADSNVAFPPRVNVDTDFDLWLVQLILAIFEVQPQELGLTADVNRATGEVQETITQRRSVRPLAMLIKEMIDDAFSVTGYADYELLWPELEERSREEIRSDAESFVPLGVMLVNEVREELGLDPLAAEDLPQQSPALDRLRRDRPKRNYDVDVPGPDDNPTLMRLQDALRQAFLDAGTRVKLQTLLDEVREAVNAGETVGDNLIQAIATLIGEAHAEELRRLIPLLADMAGIGAEAVGEAFNAAVNIELDWGLANAAAAEWAREYGYELIKGLGQTTRDEIAAAMGTWVEAQETYPDLVRRLEEILGDPRRADLVASTEATRVYAEGNKAAWAQVETELGVQTVMVWHTAADDDVCPICRPLNGATARLDEEFPGGIKSPPAHPRCRCWLTAKAIFPAQRVKRRRSPFTQAAIFATLMRGGLRVTDYGQAAPTVCGCGHTHDHAHEVAHE